MRKRVVPIKKEVDTNYGTLGLCQGFHHHISHTIAVKSNKKKHMKRTALLFIIMLSACKANKDTASVQEKEPLLHYAKGPCLGRCPVYDFWVYLDATFIYKDIKNNREIKGTLSPEEMEKLTTSLQGTIGTPYTFKRIRDLPVSKLRFGTEKYVYHASRVTGKLKATNILIEAIVKRLYEID